MKQPKERYAHTTKTERIEWTITRDKERNESKAVFYILEPQYHAHPWTACGAIKTRDGSLINTYGHQLEAEQAVVMAKAMNLAAKWLKGKPLRGKKIPAGAVEDPAA
jgi:hypothetical protein